MTPQPGDAVGAAEFRAIHRDYYKGIYVPAGSDVALSIRFRPSENDEWGYHDRWLSPGRALDYTGQGGPPSSQSWNRFNMGLRRAIETRSRVHVFEELSEPTPKKYLYWGEWVVTKWYEVLDREQDRMILRFVLEVPD